MDLFDKKLINKMPPSMRSVYDGFYGDIDKLKSEWNLCNTQYKQSLELATSKESDFTSRSIMRNVSDYWVRRRQAMERVLPVDIIESFKK